jgi:hypothetical protein
MSAYCKFSDTKQAEVWTLASPKPSKAPKVNPIEAETLGDLDALGGAEPQIPNLAMPISALDQAPATWGTTEEERAAIVEHDGKIPRAWADGFARLHPDRPPGDVPAKRWLQFVDDVGRFLDSPFCAVAITLGWEAYDLFGADRDRPYARIDRVGLLWLLNGDKLVALTDATATIETRTGRRQTYRRKPNDPGRVLAWELAELGCSRTTSLMQETD